MQVALDTCFVSHISPWDTIASDIYKWMASTHVAVGDGVDRAWPKGHGAPTRALDNVWYVHSEAVG